jgi:hypothetical protein
MYYMGILHDERWNLQFDGYVIHGEVVEHHQYLVVNNYLDLFGTLHTKFFPFHSKNPIMEQLN